MGKIRAINSKKFVIRKRVRFQHLPNLSSPKLPEPIFRPILKFGPTISTAALVSFCEPDELLFPPESISLLRCRLNGSISSSQF